MNIQFLVKGKCTQTPLQIPVTECHEGNNPRFSDYDMKHKYTV
jgi:hypothetical protein